MSMEKLTAKYGLCEKSGSKVVHLYVYKLQTFHLANKHSQEKQL